ncbi:DUF262 domain-containing protein [Salinibacterium sp. SWN167]|uniref:DUF262 domain-containing protein n=1 Tax=Salinibacterium sp. SWN167 TaxID=2792054 RepID=UPI0018CE5861|nr:DUF262 domain-containing protein [Salinibacterium sp. SWN167]MBH0081957.1 DUF262 domain-containing protein [Salinibacterium sp. SWN167]
MQQPSKATPGDLFWGPKHYEIPAYQRPYVWTEEDQWAPLWDDIVSVTETHLIDGAKRVASHFLGAVVFEAGQGSSTGLVRLDVIDGQQRLTTMQILIDAAHEVLVGRDHIDDVERLEALILNKESKYKGLPERFKLWPSQANREEFKHAMDPESESTPEVSGQIQGAHDFFSAEARRWLLGHPDDDGNVPPGTEAERAAELTETLANRLVVVSIDLTGDDDAQLIFETLNDRGTPLLKADLIKNWVFRLGKTLGADVDKWSQTVWEDFDTDWWREEITQGRMSRSRVDIFLHYWLTMRLRDEVRQDRIFDEFRDYAEPLMLDAASAESFLSELRNDADTYRGLGALSADTVPGRFRTRVIEAMELAATTPIFLWVISDNHAIPDSQITIGLDALESWVVRRTLLQLTSKDMNKLIVALLKALKGVHPAEAGERVRRFLSEQTAGTREWPTDARFIAEVGAPRMYGNIKQGRIAVVLGAVEAYKRSLSSKYGAVSLPTGLTIEHVMPQKWREHWTSTPRLTPEQEQKRDKAVHSLGNLTLVTQALNSSLSNRPWTDSQAVGLSVGGKTGKGKWSVLDEFNLLVLNKEVLESQIEWTEKDIADRAQQLAIAITKVWAGPDQGIQDAARAAQLGTGGR